MTAKDYPVTFGYLAKWGSYTHRGEDRAMPTGTPVVVDGTTIGLSGNTGKSSGPHLHLQVGTDQWAQNTVKPTDHWFKGTEIVNTGTASEWGNYVIVKNGAHYCVYAHLSKINVKRGDKLRKEYVVDSKDLDAIYRFGPLKRQRGSREGNDVYLGKSASFVLTDHANSTEGRRKTQELVETKQGLELLRKECDLLQKTLEEKNKELKSLQTALEAPQDPEPVVVIDDTQEAEKPQEHPSTRARWDFWSWFTNLFKGKD